MKLDKKPEFIGVTGTNGKTTITHLIADLLGSAKCKTAIIGTLGYGCIDNLTPSILTTPDRASLDTIITKLVSDDIKTIAMEVSSHGLIQKRIQGLEYQTVIFSNLSQDHLDYHANLEEYFLAKLKLFTDYPSQNKIINISNEYGKRLAAMLADQPVITYGFLDSNDANVQIEQYKLLADKTIFTLNTPWGKETIESSLIGKFNLENLVAALIACCLQGIELVDLKGYCKKLRPIPGRMQFFRQENSPTVVVDFAHTDDALIKTLQEVKRICIGKLWCVFGCAGNRDKLKRSKMLQAARQYSDKIIITQDNSRDEDPQLIIQDMLEQQTDGLLKNNLNIFRSLNSPCLNKSLLKCSSYFLTSPDMQNITIELDRAAAINEAITQAQPEDFIVVAGKGHESYQIIKGEKLPFSDQDQVQKFLSIKHIIGLLNNGQEISIDSRTIQPGNIFIAIIGEYFDGHKFITEAIIKGASYLIVSNTQNVPKDCKIPVLQVENTQIALGAIAKQYREQFDIKVIAITGSCGKTTTREMLVNILSETGNVLFPKNNFNNEIGLPLTLLKLNKSYQYLVLEMGACRLNDIAYLMDIAKPQVGVVTNVGVSHLEKFATQDNIAKTKGEIYTYLSSNNPIAVINTDDKYHQFFLDTMHKQNVITFGIANTADITATSIILKTETIEFELITDQGSASIRLPAPGMHNIMNALAATACARSVMVAIDAIKSGLEKFRPVTKRLTLKKGLNGATIIDDCYNASPDSVSAAIDVLSNYAGEKILVLGDMLELGTVAEQAHLDIGVKAKRLGINRIMATGELTPLTIKSFGNNGEYFKDKSHLIDQLLSRVTADTVILIKGSRSTHMEEVTSALMTD